MASKDPKGEGPGQAAAAAAPKRQREEEEEAAALRAVENMTVALDNISAQLDPLFAVPWDTLVSRCVLLPLDGQGSASLPPRPCHLRARKARHPQLHDKSMTGPLCAAFAGYSPT